MIIAIINGNEEIITVFKNYFIINYYLVKKQKVFIYIFDVIIVLNKYINY